MPGSSPREGSVVDPQEQTFAERARRDADAPIYETFFTPFQTRVEVETYTRMFRDRHVPLALEVGCGTGRTLDSLNATSRVGVNLSRREMDIARERHPDVHFVQASATHLPFREGVFDAVLCAGVVHHIAGDDTRQAVWDEMARVSGPASRIVVALHNYSVAARMSFPKEMVYHDLYWHRYTAAQLRQQLGHAFPGARLDVRSICHLPRWRIGNRLGNLGPQVDRALSRFGALARISGAILVGRIDKGRSRPPSQG